MCGVKTGFSRFVRSASQLQSAEHDYKTSRHFRERNEHEVGEDPVHKKHTQRNILSIAEVRDRAL